MESKRDIRVQEFPLVGINVRLAIKVPSFSECEERIGDQCHGLLLAAEYHQGVYQGWRAIFGREVLGGRGSRKESQLPINHPHGHKHLTVPREKGPEWDYVPLVQHEGTDEAREEHCMQAMSHVGEHVFHRGAMHIRLHFLQVPGCGVANCTAFEDTWLLMRMWRGPAVMGRGWFTG
eukprot:1139092-Pelagomonas_calceolata.AAC.5